MQEEQDSLQIQDQPLKVLGLFPIRKINTIEFDQNKFEKLYHTLCCTICQQLFKNPVYLKCSHRFCKECLQKYIRINQKKSCPNCRGDLNTKRDLKLDYGINSLINYAFGNRNKFCQSLDQIEKLQSQNFKKQTFNKNLSIYQGLIRTKSFAQQEPKSIKKKVKVGQNQRASQQQIISGQTRGRKKKINKLPQNINKPIQIEDSSRTQQIRYTETFQLIKESEKLLKTDDVIPPMKNEQIQFYRQQQQYQQQEIIQNQQKISQLQSTIQIAKKKRGRKKKQIPILLPQNKSVQFQVSQNLDVTKTNKQRLQFQPNQQSQIQKSSIQVKDKSQQSPQKIVVKSLSVIEPNMGAYLFQKQRQLLKNEFGQNYMLKIMRIPILDFLIEIKLQRHPQCYFTPIIPCKAIQLSAKCKIRQVFILLEKFLNVNIKHIKLYVNAGQNITELTFKQTQSLTLLEINQNYWKSAAEVQVFDMKEILSALDQNNLRAQNSKILNQNGQPVKKKKLFEGFNVQRQQKANPKKRGRGRARKIVQQKQNPQHIQKNEFKRVLYYRLVSQ